MLLRLLGICQGPWRHEEKGTKVCMADAALGRRAFADEFLAVAFELQSRARGRGGEDSLDGVGKEVRIGVRNQRFRIAR